MHTVLGRFCTIRHSRGKHDFVGFWRVIVGVLLSFCVCCISGHAAQPAREVMRLAIVNSYGATVQSRYFDVTISAIKQALAPTPVVIRTYSPDEFLAAASVDMFDMAIASGGLSSLMIDRTGGMAMFCVVSTRTPDPYYGNGSTIITQAHRQDITTLEDLAGKRIAIMSHNAFAGWLVPLAEVIRAGLSPKDVLSSVTVTGAPMTKIVERVQKGEVEVGFITNCLLESMQDAGLIDMNDFRIVNEQHHDNHYCKHSSDLYPNWFFTIKPTVTTDQARAIGKAFLDLPPGELGLQWTIPTDPRRVYEVFRLLDVPFGGERSLKSLLLQYRYWVIGAVIALIVILLNMVFLGVLVRKRTHEATAALQESLRMQLQAQEAALELESLQKKSAISMISGLVAHELKQPLTVINNYAGSLKRRLSRGAVDRTTLEQALAEIEHSGQQASAVIDLVRSYAKSKPREHSAVQLKQLAHETIERLHVQTLLPGVEVIWDRQDDVWVEADSLEIELVIANLVKNALKAMQDVEQPQLRLAITHTAEYAFVRVSDNGRQLSAEEFARLHSLRYSDTGSGMGLGLAIVRSLLEAHGGALEITQLADRGICCCVRLPYDGGDAAK